MLFKLSVGNIRRSLRDYAIYFFTLIIGVSVFYVFNAISSQTVYMQVSQDTREMIDTLEYALSGVSVFVAVVLGLLIVYASRFLMKRRNKEFALYLTLGMGKSRISAILLVETLIIGIGSLAVGLILGICISQLMSALVVNMFEADMSDYRFTLSGEAVAKTIIYFGIMYLIVMLFNTVSISKCRLITLMQSGRRSEKMKAKNPWVCVAVFIAAVLALAYAYDIVTGSFRQITEKRLLLSIGLGAVSTFFIFWSVSGLLLRIFMSLKGIYYRGLGSFTFRQLSSKVNTMVFSMTVICLMLFVTICTLSAAFFIKRSLDDNMNKCCRTDFEYSYYTVRDTDEAVFEDPVELFRESGVDIDEYFSDHACITSYYNRSMLFSDILGDHADEMKNSIFYPDIESGVLTYKLSEFNDLMRLYGCDEIELADDEYAVLCNVESMKQSLTAAAEDGCEIVFNGHTLRPAFSRPIDIGVDLDAAPTTAGELVVPDSVVKSEGFMTKHFFGQYNTSDKKEKREIEDRVHDEVIVGVSNYVLDNYENVSLSTYYDSRLSLRDSSIGVGALVTFLGMYTGLIFLIACGALLALKELSDSVDSISRYDMLRKLGVEDKSISGSLFIQTLIFFLLPLILACIHSIFGMKFAKLILEVFGSDKILLSVLSTSAIIILIYGGYMLITYFCSRSIIRNRK